MEFPDITEDMTVDEAIDASKEATDYVRRLVDNVPGYAEHINESLAKYARSKVKHFHSEDGKIHSHIEGKFRIDGQISRKLVDRLNAYSKAKFLNKNTIARNVIIPKMEAWRKLNGITD